MIGAQDAAAAVAGLKEAGVTVWMVTGDNARTAHAVAARVGITNVMAEVRTHPIGWWIHPIV